MHSLEDVLVTRIGTKRRKKRFRIHAGEVRIPFVQRGVKACEHFVRLSERSVVDAEAGRRDLLPGALFLHFFQYLSGQVLSSGVIIQCREESGGLRESR